jgi:hypothetical protein
MEYRGYKILHDVRGIERHLPHLWQALHMASIIPASGMCFHRSVALCLDMAPLKVVMGTLRAATLDEREAINGASEIPFIHCWTELANGDVIAPTTLNVTEGNLLLYPRAEYYGHNGVKDTYTITRREIRELSWQYGWGKAFLSGVSTWDFPLLATVLLGYAELPYKVSSDGGIIPLDA